MFGLIEIIVLVVLFAVVARQNRRIASIETELKALRTRPVGRLAAVETAETTSEAKGLGDAAATASPSADVGQPGAPTPAATTEDEAAGEKPSQGPWEQPAAAGTAAPDAGKRDIETALGTRWAVWVGGLALALGGVFLIRYTIEAGFFGPGARLTLATIFGLLLVGGGEFVRRTGYQVPLQGIGNAYIPAILTAAGAFTLFGVVYAAHGVYGFLGPATAFALLGLIGIATIAAALVHGQALAGLGLLGSLATPILVASQAPNMSALFGYLAIVLTATAVIARLRLWVFLMTAAFAGVGIWTVIYSLDAPAADSKIILFIDAVTLAVLAFAWMFRRAEHHVKPVDLPSAFCGLFVGFSVYLLLVGETAGVVSAPWTGAVLAVGLIAVALYRMRALVTLFAGGAAVSLAYASLAAIYWLGLEQASLAAANAASIVRPALALGVVFAAAGLWSAREWVPRGRLRPAAWAAWAGLAPLVMLTSLWLVLGNLDRDLAYAAVAALLVVVYAAGSEWIARAEAPPMQGGPAVSAALASCGVAALLAAHMAFGPGPTTVAIAVLAALAASVTRWRSYPALGWLSVGAALAVMVRVFVDPTIVGVGLLGSTPVFNWLLPGYGIPALAFAFSAWQLARTTAGRPRLVMEAAAALFALLTVTMLVRHAMHGGVIDDSPVTLAEQAIYTLLALGAGAILVALDQRSPSSVMRIGSIAAGVISVAFIAIQHFLLLNPLFTDESTGQIPVFNLLLLAYLLPAAAAAALALYARSKRPAWYAQMLALTAALLAFTYATLSVRRLFKGEYIAGWRGFGQVETYSYSALWLAMGVALLATGIQLKSQVLRLASAALIVLSVLKVFLFDMAELEGVLRALSFIGLGAVLIGIGLFYQRMLSRAQTN